MTYKDSANCNALDHFIFGLRGELQSKVRSCNPVSLNAAIAEAVRFEQRTSARGSLRTNFNINQLKTFHSIDQAMHLLKKISAKSFAALLVIYLRQLKKSAIIAKLERQQWGHTNAVGLVKRLMMSV